MIGENENLSSISDDLFVDGLNSPALAKLFFNCLRNIENEVKGIVLFQEEQIKNNIKVTESLQLMSDRFNKFEESIKERDDKIKNLEKQIE